MYLFGPNDLAIKVILNCYILQNGELQSTYHVF